MGRLPLVDINKKTCWKLYIRISSEELNTLSEIGEVIMCRHKNVRKLGGYSAMKTKL